MSGEMQQKKKQVVMQILAIFKKNAELK